MATKEPIRHVHGISAHQQRRITQFRALFGVERKIMLKTAIDSYLDFLELKKNYPKKSLALAVVDDQGKIVKHLL